MKTANEFIKDMQAGNVLTERAYTLNEYADQLSKFQKIVCKMFAEDEYYDGMRFDDARYFMERAARNKSVAGALAIRNASRIFEKLQKETAITMSGINGERIVAKTLEYVERPNTRIFRNVYITDGVEETELDFVALTDNGVIILEVKNVKSDLTITEDGRMVFAGKESFEKMPLGEQMDIKRRLLEKYLANAAAIKGLDIPIHVDSFIVFSTPKEQRVIIDDRYHKEKYCYRTGLPYKIKDYIGDVNYNNCELQQLDEILSAMEANTKRFENKLDFDEVRAVLANALFVLQDTQNNAGANEYIRTFIDNNGNFEFQNSVNTSLCKTISRILAACALAPVMPVGAAMLLKDI